MYLIVVQISVGNGQFWGRKDPIVSIGTFCHVLCKNG